MKGKDELEGTQNNFTPWLCDFEHQGENRWGGWYNPPLGELGLKHIVTVGVNQFLLFFLFYLFLINLFFRQSTLNAKYE